MEYIPLNAAENEVRMVTILASQHPIENTVNPSSHVPDHIECRLEHVRLSQDPLQASGEISPDLLPCQITWDSYHDGSTSEDTPNWRYTWGDYLALSYAWGDQSSKRIIMLNNHKTVISSNLESALRILSGKQPIKAGYKVWIDALCINQEDKVERAREVSRMHTIYKQARCVVIWVGVERDGSDKAMDLIRSLSNSCKAGNDKLLGNRLRQNSGLLGHGSWRALSQLLDRPFWNRLWVLQEIALGGTQSPILCGNKSVTWEELCNATYSFGTHNIDIMFSLIGQECRETGIEPLGLKRNKLIHLNKEQALQAGRGSGEFMCMLDLGRKSLVTDPRDKVYGLLGLMESGLAEQIEPDYNSTPAEVFTAFAKAMIVVSKYVMGFLQSTISVLSLRSAIRTETNAYYEGNSLEILEQCTYSTKGMPSWVPDWTEMNHFRLFSGRSTYHATKSYRALFDFSNNDQRLSCRGVRIDEIDGLGESYYENPDGRRPEDAIVQPRRSGNAYGSEDSLKDALWRTLVGNRDLRGKKVSDDYHCLLECGPNESQESSRGDRAFTQLTTKSADFLLAGKKLSKYFTSVKKHTTEALRDPQERMFRFLRTRRLMVTLTGFIGLVPIDARQGDLVCLLLGCNVPLVLRAVGDCYQKVVGGCYLHGIMEGEAMEGIEGGQTPVEKIIIC